MKTTMTPQMIIQTNNLVRRAIVQIRIAGKDVATMNQLYSAIRQRRKARDLKSRATSDHWIKLGL